MTTKDPVYFVVTDGTTLRHIKPTDDIKDLLGNAQIKEALTAVRDVETARAMSVEDALAERIDGLESSTALVAVADDLTDLGQIDASNYATGVAVYVTSVEDLYFYFTESSYAANGVSVVSATGGGVWVAHQYGRWDDIRGDVTQGANVAALTLEELRDTTFRMYFMRSGQDDSLSFIYQFPHSWDRTAVRPHIHVIPMADPVSTQNVYLSVTYSWAANEVAVPAASSWTSKNVTFPIVPGDAFKSKLIDLGLITPPTGIVESGILLIKVTRLGTNQLDTYSTGKSGGTTSANLGLLSFDVHFRKNKAGSVLEFPT